jgi:hypothetical protein
VLDVNAILDEVFHFRCIEHRLVYRSREGSDAFTVRRAAQNMKAMQRALLKA